MKPSAYYFYVKTKISVDFQICITVPLKKYMQLEKLQDEHNIEFNEKKDEKVQNSANLLPLP